MAKQSTVHEQIASINNSTKLNEITYRQLIEKADEELTYRFKDKMIINPALNRRLVSYQANKQSNGYRWCKFKEGFSAELIRYIIQSTKIKSGKILDPFAGSGTTLFVSSELGIEGIGIELLPNCAEVINAKKILLEHDQKKMIAELSEFQNKKSWEKPGKTITFPHLRITFGAFPIETEKLLGRYLYDISRLKNKEVAQVLKFVALCILESISYTRKDGQYLRWDYRAGRRLGKKPFNKGKITSFTEGINEKIEEIKQDILNENSLFKYNDSNIHSFPIKLHLGSCIKILPSLRNDSFDGIITSPPYCNRYDYTRTYALELAMLGANEEKVKELRQSMLSCTVENRDKILLEESFSPEILQKGMNAYQKQDLLQKINQYLDFCRENKMINNSGIPRMVRNYFKEMALVIFECSRVLKYNAPFIMVNDNVQYQGVQIPVDLILSDIASSAGFSVDSIWVLPKGKGNSSQQMSKHGRKEQRKCVYVWRLTG